MRTIAYLRVSKDSQDVKNKRLAILDFARQERLEIDEFMELSAKIAALETAIAKQYTVQRAGRIPDVKERFFAISVERRLKHPAVIAISNAARNTLFGTHNK